MLSAYSQADYDILEYADQGTLYKAFISTFFFIKALFTYSDPFSQYHITLS